ncbi:MAG: hypothetical protein ABW122_00760 [Ilumatobacteraceae bacterium]
MRPGVASERNPRRASLKYELERMVQEVRLGDLGQRLATGELLVRSTTYRRAGRRVRLVLDGGGVLALRLFWPRRDDVAAIVSMRDEEQVGWVVVTRTTDGRRLVFYAWLAHVESATDPPAR